MTPNVPTEPIAPVEPEAEYSNEFSEEVYEAIWKETDDWTNKQGADIARAALDNAYGRRSPYKIIISRIDGKTEGVLSYLLEDEAVLIENVGTSGRVRGVGTGLIREAANIASNSELALRANATTAARTFYDRLGMALMPGYANKYEFTLDQVRQFLTSGV